VLNLKKRLNQKGGAGLITIVIILIVLMLIGGGAVVYFTIKDQNIEFSQEVIDEATALAQEELNKAFELTEKFTFEERFEAIQSIGYTEPEEGEFAIFTSEKIYEDEENIDYYVILKIKPHEQYEYLTRIAVSIFDTEHGALIVELENILKWQKELDQKAS